MSERLRWSSCKMNVKNMGSLVDIEKAIDSNTFEGISIVQSFDVIIFTAQRIQVTLLSNKTIHVTILQGITKDDFVTMFQTMKKVNIQLTFVTVVGNFIAKGLLGKFGGKLGVTQNIEPIKNSFIETCWSMGIFPDVKKGHKIHETFKCKSCDEDHQYPLSLSVNEWSIELKVETFDHITNTNKKYMHNMTAATLINLSKYFKDGTYIDLLGGLIENYMEIVEMKYQARITKEE